MDPLVLSDNIESSLHDEEGFECVLIVNLVTVQARRTN